MLLLLIGSKSIEYSNNSGFKLFQSRSFVFKYSFLVSCSLSISAGFIPLRKYIEPIIQFECAENGEYNGEIHSVPPFTL